jgi:hypothetical protein
MPELKLANFSLGQSRDAALRQNKYWSLRDMVNFEIIYTDGRMRVRKGSARWNDTALPAEPTQLFWWVDDDENEHLLVLCSDLVDRWYEAKAVGAHQMIIDELATAWCIAQPVGNRLILGTDHNLFWTDHDALTGGPPYAYRLGIKKPTVAPGASVITTEGTWQGAVYPNVPGSHGFNATTKRKVAARFTAGYTQRVRGLPIPFYFATTDVTKLASIRASIYTEVGGAPGVLLSSDAVSDWVFLQSHGIATWGIEFFRFQDKIDLVSATDYFVVLEPDEDYYTNYNAATFFMYLGYFAPTPINTAWDQNLAGTWVLSPNLTSFWLGGIYDAADESPYVGTAYYQYVMTYLNSTYGIESRPSEPLTVALAARNMGTWRSPRKATVNLKPIAPVDPQVDMFRFYRRKIGDDPSISEALITDTYKLVSEDVFTVANVNDSTPDGYLGAQLQTQNNYCYDDVDPADDSQRQSALTPYLMTYWKGRLIWIELAKRMLWFSNLLEKNGASGYVGEEVLDFFALQNKLDLALTSDVIALEPLSEDELAIYLRDEHIWVLRGGDEPLNPPPDFAGRELLMDNGLIATRGVAPYKSRHIYLGRDSVGSFGGSQIPLVTVSSESNQSIFDGIQDRYIRNSIVRVFGNEIWFLLDTDNDGQLETIMILDMLHGVPGELTSHRPWRTYRYSESLNDITLKRQFDDFRSMLGASADSNYILELGTGTTDLGSPINWLGETHDLRGKNMMAAYGLRIKGSYPSTPPAFTITATDHGGNTETYTFTPESSEDIRGQRTGLRFNRAHSVRVKIEGSSTEADELLEMALEYKEE